MITLAASALAGLGTLSLVSIVTAFLIAGEVSTYSNFLFQGVCQKCDPAREKEK